MKTILFKLWVVVRPVLFLSLFAYLALGMVIPAVVRLAATGEVIGVVLSFIALGLGFFLAVAVMLRNSYRDWPKSERSGDLK